MASQEINLRLSTEMQSVKPDGSKCVACGDACYLSQHVLYLIINGKKTQSDLVLCGSCCDFWDD